jgi:hypothetical protein
MRVYIGSLHSMLQTESSLLRPSTCHKLSAFLFRLSFSHGGIKNPPFVGLTLVQEMILVLILLLLSSALWAGVSAS